MDTKTRLQHLEKQNSLLLLFLYDTVGLRPPDCHATSPEGNYGGSLFRCTTGSGGYVVIKQFDGGVPQIVYLDDIGTGWPAEIRALTERLKIQRKKLCDQEDANIRYAL